MELFASYMSSSHWEGNTKPYCLYLEKAPFAKSALLQYFHKNGNQQPLRVEEKPVTFPDFSSKDW